VAILALYVIGTFSVYAHDLEIIQPKAGLTTANRYYRAYPGFPYEVQISGIGGLYPYQYSLVDGPAGMSVDPSTGVLAWANPVERAEPYSVSARILDSSGDTQSVTWSILVTTQGFKFVDAVNGKTAAEGADGSIANPWKTIVDWYRTKYDKEFSGVFLYFREGTYRVADAPIEDNWRLAILGFKPVVWMAYPGENPIIDTDRSHLSFYGSPDNLYIEGFQFRNFTASHGIVVASDTSNVTIRKNQFRDMPANSNPGGTNLSAIMISNAVTRGQNWTIASNSFSNIYNRAFGLLGYSADKALILRNTFTNFDNPEAHAIGPKMNNNLWFIRDNKVDIAQGIGIWVDTYTTSTNFEISYNLVRVGTGNAAWYGQEDVEYGLIASFRNTYIGAPIRVDNLTSSRGPVSFRDDVVATNAQNSSGFEGYNNQDLLRLQKLGLIVAPVSQGVVDSSGNLGSGYQQYVGQKGYQRNGFNLSLAKPVAPVMAVR
jgi:hypothetical protein